MSYDPTQGRFIEQDPTGFPDGPDRYRAFSDNPLQLVDPFGLQASPTSRPSIDPKLRHILKDAKVQAVLIKAFEDTNPKGVPEGDKVEHGGNLTDDPPLATPDPTHEGKGEIKLYPSKGVTYHAHYDGYDNLDPNQQPKPDNITGDELFDTRPPSGPDIQTVIDTGVPAIVIDRFYVYVILPPKGDIIRIPRTSTGFDPDDGKPFPYTPPPTTQPTK